MSRRRVRILFLSPHPPTPVKRRTLNFVRHAARRHEVHLRVLTSSHELRRPPATAMLERLRAECASVDTLTVPLPRRLAAAASDYMRGADLRTAYMHGHDRFAAILRRDCDRLRVDVVHADRMRLGRLAARIGRPALLDLPDCLSWGMERWAAESRGLRAMAYRAEAKRLRACEGDALNRLPVVTVASEDDGRQVRASGYRGRVLYLPGIIEFLESSATPPPSAAGPLLVFHGTLSYRPNVDAITAFCRDVLPLLRRRFPKLVLSVVGARPVAAVRRLGAHGVRVFGDVEEIAPWVGAATAVVAPMRVGVGHSQKVCEALLARRPVICSPLAADRVDPTVRAALLVARSPAEWLAHLERLVDDPARGTARAEDGYVAVQRCYGAAAVMPRLEDAYEAALEAWADAHPGARRAAVA